VKHSPVSATRRPGVPAGGGSVANRTAPIAPRSHRGTSSTASSVERRVLTELDPARARSRLGLADVPTIAAIGPFDDRADAQLLAAAFIAVRQCCTAQLVLIGVGAQRATVIRRVFAQGFGGSLHAARNPGDNRWSDLVAAADLVVLSSSSGTATLLNVLAAGRPVIAPADAATVQLVVPAIAGLVYPPGDVSGMEGALLRLLTTPVLRRGMGGRARQVARRRHLEISMRNRPRPPHSA
jgi:glycosyltransferase involved in cell wall biosynthesis